MFTCHFVENVDNLMYSWSKTEDTTMKMLDNLQTNSSVLLIPDVTVSDSGYYQCHVYSLNNYIASSTLAQLAGNYMFIDTKSTL